MQSMRRYVWEMKQVCVAMEDNCYECFAEQAGHGDVDLKCPKIQLMAKREAGKRRSLHKQYLLRVEVGWLGV